MRIRFSAAAAALFFLLPAGSLFAAFSRTQDFRDATPAELALKSAAGEPAIVLDWVRIDDDTASKSEEYVRIKVFSEAGKKYGDVEVTYVDGYPLLGFVTDINARTIRPDGTKVPFDGKVYDKILYKSGGRSLHAKTFSLPDVQPGSILEYRYVRRWSDSVLINTSWLVQRSIPVVHSKFTLKPYPRGDFQKFFTYRGLPEGKKPVKTNDHYDIEFENTPAFQQEAFAPPEEMLKPSVNFYYTSSVIRPENFWAGQSADWNKEVERFIGRAGTAKDLVAELKAPTPQETLRKIYARVQGLTNYSFTPTKDAKGVHSVEEVLTNKGGYRDEIGRTFVALARAAGFDADVYRAAPRDESFFSDQLPDAEQMSDEIAVVTLDGKPIYLDPGTPGAPFGTVSWEKTDVPAIHFSRKSPAQFAKTGPTEPRGAVMQRRADLRLEGDDLKGTVTISFQGQEALVRRLAGDDDAARKKAIEHEVKGWFPNGTTVELKSAEGLSGVGDALVVTYDVQLPNALTHAGSRLLLPISVFTVAATNPFSATTRTHPIYFHYARREDDRVKVTLPESVSVPTLPPPANMNAGAVIYKNEVKRDGQTITLERLVDYDVIFVSPEQYSVLRNVFASVVAGDQRLLLLQQAAQ
jgi:hypothetical protein